MKLALIGVVTLALGIALSVPGLIAAGGFWIVTGPLMRAFVQKREDERAAAQGRAAAEAKQGAEDEEPGPDTGRFALDTLVMLAVGLPPLALGVLEIGFPEAERAWRFVPIAVGGLGTSIAVVSGGMMALGSGLVATAEAVGVPEHPGRITIRSARETGVYVNERPRLEFELTVEPDGLPAYEVAKKATVPHTALGSISPGDGFRALVHPDKPSVMEIDWSSPIPGDGGGEDASERVGELEQLLREGKITKQEFDQHRRRILDSI